MTLVARKMRTPRRRRWRRSLVRVHIVAVRMTFLVPQKSLLEPSPVRPEARVPQLGQPSRPRTPTGNLGGRHLGDVASSGGYLPRRTLLHGPLNPLFDVGEQLERFDGRHGVHGRLGRPLRYAPSGIGVGQDRHARLLRIVRIPLNEIGPPQRVSAAYPSSVLPVPPPAVVRVTCRSVLVLDGLIDHYLCTVPSPSMGAEGDEISRLDEEYLRRLTPRDLGVGGDFLQVAVGHDEIVVLLESILVREIVAHGLEGGVDGSVHLDAGVLLFVVVCRSEVVVIVIVAPASASRHSRDTRIAATGILHPLEVTGGRTVLIELLPYHLVARHLLPSVLFAPLVEQAPLGPLLDGQTDAVEFTGLPTLGEHRTDAAAAAAAVLPLVMVLVGVVLPLASVGQQPLPVGAGNFAASSALLVVILVVLVQYRRPHPSLHDAHLLP
mmetsp:Transcript_28682/g.84540  ORF Transcript_28682/g.84540 Transcript_28682/m.84540 type:complete len:437 (-) Transcript_28682:514-1824(-)